MIPSVAPSSHATVPKSARILACVLCQHRKIKCDRTFPCAHCTKANVKCTPSTPAPARKRRRPNQDLQERLARCEELLKEYATGEKVPDPPATVAAAVPQLSPASSVHNEAYTPWQLTGKLVRESGGTRFMDNFLFGTIYDELRAMREIVDADDADDTTPDTMTPDDNSDLVLGVDTPRQAAEDLWPEPGHVFRLWQVFLERVHPLTKIIHVPTLQPHLAEATSTPHNTPKNVETLLFSVFLLAAIAMTPEECHVMLGAGQEESLRRFSSGVRLGLMRMGFLKSHDLTTLQALVMYLISLQGRYNRHAAWVLNGVVIRIAQKMGLHRDGELLGLSPFDTELRRRLWWQIIMLDAKYAMQSGLSHSLLPRSWDTKEPKNVNDGDLYPSATEPFQDRDGPTEMIFVLMINKVTKFLVQSPGLEAMVYASELDTLEDGSASAQFYADYQRTLNTLNTALVELLDRYCDPRAGPVHQITLEMRNHILAKLGELTMPPRQRPEWGGEIRSLQDNAFKVAVSSLEHNALNYESTKDKGFLWYTKLHFQTDMFTYLVGQLCRRTEGALVERAWAQVDVVFRIHPELLDVAADKAHATLAIFILKAWTAREDVLCRAQGGRGAPRTPFYVERLRAQVGDEYRTEPTPNMSDPSPVQSFQHLPPKPVNGGRGGGLGLGLGLGLGCPGTGAGTGAGTGTGPAAAMGAAEGGVASATAEVASAGHQAQELGPGFDQFLGGYLDAAAVEWDMFGVPPTMPVSAGPPPPFGYPMGGPMGQW